MIILLKVQSYKLHNNKYMITSTQITYNEIVLVVPLFKF